MSTALVDDHNGGTDSATVTATIQGTNDEPAIASGVTAAITDQAGLTGPSLSDRTPVSLHFTDPDLNNIGHTATVTGASASG